MVFVGSLTFVGLIFVCLGTGGIKPCVSAFGADQVVLEDNDQMNPASDSTSSSTTELNPYLDNNKDASEVVLEDDNSHREEKVDISQENKENSVREFFNSFYFCINVGALLSFAIIPMIRANYGFGATFFLPTMSMMGALGIFMSQRKAYKHRIRDFSQPSLLTTLHVCSRILCTNFCGNHRLFSTEGRYLPVFTASDPSNGAGGGQPETVTQTREEAATGGDSNNRQENNNHQVRREAEQVLHLMPLMLFFPVFWMLYDQQGSVWMLQATRLNSEGLQPEQSGVRAARIE